MLIQEDPMYQNIHFLSFHRRTVIVLRQLNALAMIGDLHGVARVATVLQQQSPDLQRFSQHVIQLAKEYEEETLINLLHECLNSAEMGAQTLVLTQ